MCDFGLGFQPVEVIVVTGAGGGIGKATAAAKSRLAVDVGRHCEHRTGNGARD